MAHFTTSTWNSTPMVERHIRFALPLSPIQSVSSLEYDSALEDFVQRGDMVRQTMMMKYKKCRERVEEGSLIPTQNKAEDCNQFSLVTAPSMLTRWCSMRMDHSCPLGSDLLEPTPFKRTQSALNISHQPNKQEEDNRSDYPYALWSKDESVNDPWTKAANREYTLKRKATIQRRKRRKREEKKSLKKDDSARWSPLSFFRRLFATKSRK